MTFPTKPGKLVPFSTHVEHITEHVCCLSKCKIADRFLLLCEQEHREFIKNIYIPSTMDVLYHQTNKLIQDVGSELGRLEKAKEDTAHLVENEIQAHLDHVISNCERLDILVNKEPPARRANAKMRVDQLKYDCQHVQAALRNIQHKRYMRAQADQEREALLSRTFTTNDQNDATSVYIDPALQHHTKLSGANTRMDELMETGSNILSNLRDQRGTLKGVHRKVLDMANTLGLTGTVMRLIERRTAQDKIILVVGMVVTCLIMYLVWSYFT